MTEPVQVVRALVNEIGGGEATSVWADRLLRRWREDPNQQFGSFNIVLSARAAALVASPRDLEDEMHAIGTAWLESRAPFCARRTFEGLAEAAFALDTKHGIAQHASLLPKLRDALVAIWAASHGRDVAVEGLHFTMTDEGEPPSPELALDMAAALAGWHPSFRGRESEVRTMLRSAALRDRLVEELAGGPRRLLSAAELRPSIARDLEIRTAATAAIWREEMLDAGAVALSLGSKPTNREKVRSLRKQSRLLGLPHANRYVYPRFQLDWERRRVYPTVENVNRLLRAADDPWGVASWWTNTNALLEGRPCDLVGCERDNDVWRAACALVDADPEKKHPVELSAGAAG